MPLEVGDKPGFVVDGHFSGMPIAGHLKQPTREIYCGESLILGLAPDGVYLAPPVTRRTVSSYLAIAPLPPTSCCSPPRFASQIEAGGDEARKQWGRYLFCGTFLPFAGSRN